MIGLRSCPGGHTIPAYRMTPPKLQKLATGWSAQKVPKISQNKASTKRGTTLKSLKRPPKKYHFFLKHPHFVVSAQGQSRRSSNRLLDPCFWSISGPYKKIWTCVCVCAWEKGREKTEREARIHMHVCARKRVYTHIYIYMCVWVCALSIYLAIYLSILI